MALILAEGSEGGRLLHAFPHIPFFLLVCLSILSHSTPHCRCLSHTHYIQMEKRQRSKQSREQTHTHTHTIRRGECQYVHKSFPYLPQQQNTQYFKYTLSHTHTHTLPPSPSLFLSHSHTHTHTHTNSLSLS